MATSYTLRFSDPSNPDTIEVLGTDVGTGKNNYSTSLDLVGPGYTNYGLDTAQNFLKLLENFASPNPPSNPIKGQLWYDTSNPSRPVLRINNGSITSNRWPSATGIYQQESDPIENYTNNVVVGDIWVDTGTDQMKIRTASEWLTVGPASISGTGKTGSEGTTLTSSTGTSFPVILNWVNGKVVEIIAYNNFTPQTVVDGFTSIKAGTNLTSRNSAKYYGVAENAAALYLSPGQTIKASDVLKNKTTNPQYHTGTFVVDAVDGLWVKSSTVNAVNRIQLASAASSGQVLYTKTTGGSFQVGIGNGTTDNPVYFKFVADDERVGLNTASPSATLDVAGTGKFSGAVTLTSLLSVSGNVSLSSNVSVGANLRVTGVSTLTNNLYIGGDILPTTPVSLGTQANYFDEIYVSNIRSPGGYVTIYGSVSTATQLLTSRNFGIQGQMTTTAFVGFNGTASVVMNTIATEKLVTDQTNASETTGTLTLFVVDTSTSASVTGPQKISKADFLADLYDLAFQTGMIISCGTSTMVGFLSCNGQEYNSVGTYSNLYSVIGERYGSSIPGVRFMVPNLVAPVSTTTLVTTSTFYLIKT